MTALRNAAVVLAQMGMKTSENSSAADGHLMVASNYTQASDCDDGDPCTDDHFVNGKCMHYTKTCNDKYTLKTSIIAIREIAFILR